MMESWFIEFDWLAPRRQAPAHMELQTKLNKKIAEIEGIKYNEAMKKLKGHIAKAIGMPWDEAKASGKMTWMEALQKLEKNM